MAIQIVSFYCVLKDSRGQVISSTFNQNILTAKQENQKALHGLTEALQDLQKGEKRQVCLRADKAYGFYNPELVVVRRLDELNFSEPVKLGESIVYITNGVERRFRVTEISAVSITLDGNHPLAGQDLVFEIEATEARAATPEELLEDTPVTTQFVESTRVH